MKLSSSNMNSLTTISTITLITIFCVGCDLINSAPVIYELTADNDYLCMGASSVIHASATDPDNDELMYTWVTSSGEIKGEGSSVYWKAPSIPGAHTITLTVTNSKGRKAVRTLALNVLPNRPPIIERLTMEQAGCGGGESVPIECVASDPDGDKLSYKWTATGGEISGHGSTVSWTAPEKRGKYTISVEVTDGNCGEITREKTVRVT